MIEGAVLLVAGLVAVADGLRLVIFKNPRSVEDITGPGRYLLVISVLMVVVGAAHLLASWRPRPKDAVAALIPAEDIAWRRLALTAGALVVYLVLLDLVGYFPSTLLFFVLILRAMGEPLGLRLAFLSIAFAVSLYVVFVRLCGMTFPHGLLFT